MLADLYILTRLLYLECTNESFMHFSNNLLSDEVENGAVLKRSTAGPPLA